ncbi:MAG: hypothetical protein Q8S53_03360 [Brevundimonas sp.]|uniref:hypothetical protein n=1 Tax=Brevundimonas sp. TaxID=1871086 RepID=UPI002735DF94|nr:hypothetical protein [Brevundimonas sp.]MDP3377378.1 hypothetical protein [Brevundimonas sp.]
MKKLLLFSLLITAVVIGAVRVDFAFNPEHRVAALKGLCEAGFPNLSIPAGVEASDWGCSIFSPMRRVSGFADSTGEPRFFVIGDRYRFDHRNRLTNEVVRLVGDFGSGQPPAPSASCYRAVMGLSVEGWTIESEHVHDQSDSGFDFFLMGHVPEIRAVEPGAVVMRRSYDGDYGCVWGGEEGWISLAPPTPDP